MKKSPYLYLFFISLVGVFLMLSLFAHIPQAVAEELQVSRIELEVDWPTLPSLDKSLNDLANEKIELQEIVLFVYTLLLWISAFAAFVALVYAGFLYIVSGANPAMRAQAFVRIKRIAIGGVILLLSVLILSFINADLIEVDVSINELYCDGVENVEACKKELTELKNLGTGYFDIDSASYKYPIRAISETEFEGRLVESATWLLQQTLKQNEFRQSFKCTEENTCEGTGDTNLQACEDWKNFCQAWDMNDDQFLNEDDINEMRDDDLLSILDRGCVDFGKNTLKIPGLPTNPLAPLGYIQDPLTGVLTQIASDIVDNVVSFFFLISLLRMIIPNLY